MTKKQKISLYKIIIGIVIFISGYFLPVNNIIKAVIFLAAYLFCGYDVIIKAFKNLFKAYVLDENFLMAVATIGAIAIGEYPEAVFVMIFYKVGELFESVAVGKSRKSISSLMDIRPDYANIVKNGKIEKVDPETVKINDVITVEPGEKIPLDGIVIKGSSNLNTMALTGESAPQSVEINSEVMSGCININGVLEIKVTKEFYDSTVNKILELVENSAANKAESENFITHFAKYYTPIVVVSALLLAVIPPIFMGDFAMWFKRALIFLVVSCPCALVISVPLSFFAGIGKASKYGILIKGSNYLEALSHCETVIFDKTGTLTHGNFFVSAVHPNKISDDKLLKLAAQSEYYSNHPISVSLKNAYGKEIDKNSVSDVEEISGYGVSAVIDKKKVYCGNSKLMKKIGADYHDCHHVGTIVHVCVDGEYMGHIVICDEIKYDSMEAIKELKKIGVKKTVMLTGDKKEVGEDVGKKLGIDEIHSELLPQNKVECVEKLITETKKNKKLVFVGDGINDAPVLTRADIGISMGSIGSDAAIEASDVVLMDDKPSKIALAIKISQKTNKIVWQNIAFALFIKLVVLALGAMGYANMWEASFADVGVSVIAILNAMRMFL